MVEAATTETAAPEGERIPGCVANNPFSEPEKVIAMFREAGLERISLRQIPLTEMTNKDTAQWVGVPYNDEYVVFTVFSAKKRAEDK